ncbi:olfactory receptor 11A1-like [Entelurus aequoreus]|uniref:olfactory receptor 11A1-like n=1 Tax=Entelurus aequoreus TaxID=161455 RepID=UPI002B1D60A4|nr:olfactory receptor 11A1-like [Entelurus aequoreus]
MDAEFNGTFITLGGLVDLDQYRYLYFVIFLTLYILILFTNGTIICVICIHRNLHEPMYIFIAALSLNSLLFSTAIYPKLCIDVLSQKQTISHSACLFQYFLFYSFAKSDFLLLSAMAYDRYVSICKPLQYPTIMGKRTVVVLLTLAWCAEVRKKALETCLPHLIVLFSFVYLPKIVHLIMTLQIVVYSPLFNPIIYGVKMKEIWKHIKRLFCQLWAALDGVSSLNQFIKSVHVSDRAGHTPANDGIEQPPQCRKKCAANLKDLSLLKKSRRL